MSLFLQLFQTMAIFLVVGYLYCKSPWFRPLTNQNLDRRDKVYLYFFFSALSIMGTYLGHPVQGALANTRAIGPVLAGMIGGPVSWVPQWDLPAGYTDIFRGASQLSPAVFQQPQKVWSVDCCAFI